MAYVIGRFRIEKPYEEWLAAFNAHGQARRDAGIEDIFCAPVIGAQEVTYIVRTDQPRMVHDLMWGTEAREAIESSGHVLGSEEFIVCDSDPVLSFVRAPRDTLNLKTQSSAHKPV